MPRGPACGPGFCGPRAAPLAAPRKRWDGSIDPLPPPTCSHRRPRWPPAGQGRNRKQITAAHSASGRGGSGTRASMPRASVGSGRLTEAARRGRNVPFVPLTLSSLSGRTWEPLAHGAGCELAPQCEARGPGPRTAGLFCGSVVIRAPDVLAGTCPFLCLLR